MAKRTNKTQSQPEFIRKTVTIPGELEKFVESRSKQPEHAGNLSSYIRTLILRDREKNLAVAA